MIDSLANSVLSRLSTRQQELVDLACQLVATPSPNPPGDESRVVDFTREVLRARGYERIEILATEPQRPNLLASIGPVGGRSLVLSGHLDTKPPGEEKKWLTPPYEPTIIDGRLYGLGTADMKGAIAAMILAGWALAEEDALGGELRLVLTADEEAGAAAGAKYLVGQLDATDGILVGEPTGIERAWEYLAVASRGVACFRVLVRGTQMHSSLTDRFPAVNASVKLAEVLMRFSREFRPTLPEGSPWGPTVNPGVTLKGGVFYGVCPGEAEFGVDIRTVPGMTLIGVKADVESFLESLREEDPHLEVEAIWDPGNEWFPPSSVDPKGPLVQAARWGVQKALGYGIPDGLFPGGTEGAIWATRGFPVVPAIGPGRLTDAHRPNESVGVDEIIAASQIYALTALQFLSHP